jgi:outer membrane murein-binding lipoprotein Lpp
MAGHAKLGGRSGARRGAAMESNMRKLIASLAGLGIVAACVLAGQSMSAAGPISQQGADIAALKSQVAALEADVATLKSQVFALNEPQGLGRAPEPVPHVYLLWGGPLH